MVWTAGLIVIGLGVWLLARAVSAVLVVVVPCAIGLLVIALLSPLNQWLRRRHWPRPLAALGSVLALILLLAGVGILTGFSVASHLTDLQNEFSSSLSSLQQRLAGWSLPVNADSLRSLESRAQQYLAGAGAGITSTLLKVTQATVDVATGVVLALFVVIFVLWDGERVWSWFCDLFGFTARRRIAAAGDAAWTSLTGFIQGTFIIASIHGVVIGTTLFILGVPIFIPLAILVFLGSFIPVVGAFIAGAVAVVITLGTQGLVPGLIILVVLLAENELEAHVLQPFVVGRYLRLHPLAIILVLTAGSFLAGIPGALLSVPAAGVAHAAWGPLNGHPSAVPPRHRSRISRAWDWLQRRRGRSRHSDESGDDG